MDPTKDPWDLVIALEDHQPHIFSVGEEHIVTIRLQTTPMHATIEAKLNSLDEPTEARLYNAIGESAPVGVGTKAWKWIEAVIAEQIDQ